MRTFAQDHLAMWIHRETRVRRVERELGEAVLGGIVGAVTGAIAGLPGLVTGAIIGFLIGLLAGVVGENEDQRAAMKTRRLDEAIGVTRGSLGTVWVRHVPPRIGAYSAGASGAGIITDHAPVEGPMPEDGA